MSAQPNTNDNLVSIEIDGKTMQAPKGSMIIQAADKAGIPIPRFCYHPKLAVAANCRQCLVEVEMNGKPIPKPQPACSTPVGEGMKVATRSDNALRWQRSVMEFLLINHPLDCPICDQGGECELQDIALGYGRSVNRFTERKRSVADEDIGPLIATEMTRCIHCTRCVRVLGEIAGTNEFGSMNRGEHLEIGTYIGKAVESEIGGNIIDVCPVGALTNKPFRFKARAWELLARPSIGYHDALGSNLWLHTRRGEILRTVPRDNEAVNECWLSDRDRYSHEGLYADDRATRPQVKRNGTWQDTDWDDALDAAAEVLKSVPAEQLGILVHPSASCEEGELLNRLAKGLGTAHIDHRLRQLDFSDQARASKFGLPVEQFDKLDAALVMGSDLRSEMPLLHQRLRQASKGFDQRVDGVRRTRFDISKRKGASIHVLNPARFSFNYALASETIVAPQALVDEALVLAAAAVEIGADVSAEGALAEALKSVQPTDTARATFKALNNAEQAVVLLGEAAALHPEASWLRAAARLVAKAAGAAFAEIPVGANAVGLAATGVLPGQGGLDAHAMLAQPRKGYVLFGVEPPFDVADGAQALKALQAADKVVAFTAYASDTLREVADVILPIAMLPETDATLINADGRVQTLAAGATAPGDALAGWRVLRALGGRVQAPQFEFDDMPGLRDTMSAPQAPSSPADATPGPRANGSNDGLVRLATVPMYRGDAVLRRAGALNAHPLTRGAAVRINAQEASRLGLADGDTARVADTSSLTVAVDDAVPDGTAWIESAYAQTATLPPYGATLNVSKA
jgi:NADH-quinone oxidoreductase subunit G